MTKLAATSQTIDTNVLVYASNDDSPRHEVARDFLDAVAAGPELVVLFWPTIIGYLRIATHSSIFPVPLSPAAATANVTSLLGRPHVRTVGERDGFWEQYLRATEGVNPRGNLVPDAHLAALMRHHSIPVIWTGDRDFRKFDGITARNPFEPE